MPTAAQTPAPTPTATVGEDSIVARLGAQKQKFKAAARALTTERDALRQDNTKLRERNAELEKKADGSAAVKRVAELEGQLREVAHRKVFDRVAKDRGVPEDSLDLVYQHSGYQAEGEEPDEVAIGQALDAAKAKPGVSRLFAPPQTPTTTPTGTPIKPGPGSDRGKRADTLPPSAVFGGEDDPRINDVSYIMRNYDTVVKTSQDRLARGEV